MRVVKRRLWGLAGVGVNEQKRSVVGMRPRFLPAALPHLERAEAAGRAAPPAARAGVSYHIGRVRPPPYVTL